MIEKTGNKCAARLPQRELRHETGGSPNRRIQPERYAKYRPKYFVYQNDLILVEFESVFNSLMAKRNFIL
jgi:hypothetical protein